jgi:carbamoyl-phosphate synthase large subunit
VVGLLNLQLAVKDERIWVLEANPRASRTVPFVSKVIGVSLARWRRWSSPGARSRIFGDGVVPQRPASLPAPALHEREGGRAAVRPVPGRRHGARARDEVDRRGDGDRRGRGMALAKAMVAAGHALPTSGSVFVSVANRDKRAIVFPARRLADLGFRLLATSGTAGVLERAGIAVERVAKVSEGEDNVVGLIRAGAVDLVINTPFGRAPRSDGSFIRTAAARSGSRASPPSRGVRRGARDRGAPG